LVYKQLQQRDQPQQSVNVSTLRGMKADGVPIACLTAYDASFAWVVDQAGADVVLVGDSLGMVIQGHETTVPVTVADMIYHTRVVARGLRRAFLMTDMPFMSYTTPAQALENAVRLMQDGGAMMVKLEGGPGQIRVVEHLAQYDIPLCAHIGLRPQSVHKLGGFRVQGRESGQARQMVEDAAALERAGADIILLECVPNEVGRAVRDAVKVPVIGIGAGPAVDGQILVLYDMLGITAGRMPKFVQNFMEGAASVPEACARYVRAVKERAYPAPQHCFS
jgi:3-methyl-2-oxobutanoate hydroxymethyltransferase